MMRLWPDLPQVACFDTAFHRGRAQVTERFGLPDELFRRGGAAGGSMGYRTSTSPAVFAALLPTLAAAGSLSPTWAAAPACAP